MSVPSPAIKGRQLAPSTRAASAMAASSGTASPPIHACSIAFPPRPPPPLSGRSGVVLDVGEALVGRRRAFERAAALGRLPVNRVLDFSGEFEILVGDPLRGMVLQAHLDPRIGGCNVWMMPRCLGQMSDGVDHHQGAFPAVRLVLAADPAAFQVPMRQVALEPFGDL